MSAARYLGRVASTPRATDFAFIGIATVTKEDGSPHDLGTAHDIFLHQDDCAVKPRVGMMVAFDVIPDSKRGEGYFRATAGVRHSAAEKRELELLGNVGSLEIRLPGVTIVARRHPSVGIKMIELGLEAAGAVAERLSETTRYRKLAALGFVRVDGLIAKYPLGEGQYLIAADPDQLGRWDQDSGLIVLNTDEGEVWLRVSREREDEKESLTAIIREFALVTRKGDPLDSGRGCAHHRHDRIHADGHAGRDHNSQRRTADNDSPIATWCHDLGGRDMAGVVLPHEMKLGGHDRQMALILWVSAISLGTPPARSFSRDPAASCPPRRQ